MNKFEIDHSKLKIEKDELNETELTNLNTIINEIKQNLNRNSKQIENKILNNSLLIDQLKKVNIKYSFWFLKIFFKFYLFNYIYRFTLFTKKILL